MENKSRFQAHPSMRICFRQHNPRLAFQLSPSPRPIEFPKSRDFPNRVPHRDGFSAGDLAHNAETHDK
jgi:hypothetical protein